MKDARIAKVTSSTEQPMGEGAHPTGISKIDSTIKNP